MAIVNIDKSEIWKQERRSVAMFLKLIAVDGGSFYRYRAKELLLDMGIDPVGDVVGDGYEISVLVADEAGK